jgi:hypothetical protein
MTRTITEQMNAFTKPLLKELGILLVFLCLSVPAAACTIFVLTDANQALFCNNEDWSNPKTRIWFVPPGDGHYGCAYVGFDDGFAQGGFNTEGLAYDVVAGFGENLQADPNLSPVRGSPCQRIIETCATVEEAIEFYRTHQVSFDQYGILMADRTGASVILGARNGKLLVERANQCRGFGYGAQALDRMLAQSSEASVANGTKILRAVLQKGPYSTKYSNVFDLKTGDIIVLPLPDRGEEVRMNLETELKKAAHYYDIPSIQEQLAEAPRPLLTNMRRFLLDELKPVPDREPEVTARARAIFKDAINGTLRADDFTADSWKQVAPGQKGVQDFLRGFGELSSVILVDRADEGGQRHYRYLAEFTKATLLYHFVFDEQGRHVFGNPEDVKWKTGTGQTAEITPEIQGARVRKLKVVIVGLMAVGLLPLLIFGIKAIQKMATRSGPAFTQK